jgi:hypothetical protein
MTMWATRSANPISFPSVVTICTPACRANFETIRGWIAESQSASGWSVMITAVARAAASGIALRIDPLDVAGSLVRIAIERAKH